MSGTASSDNMLVDFDEIFHQVSTYFEGVIAREVSSFQIASRLNWEMPVKMEDTRRSVIAMLAEMLVEQGEKAASSLNAQARIRYYDDRIEERLASECSLPEWTPWRPSLTEHVRNTGIVLTGVFGLEAVLAAFRSTSLSSFKIPFYAASPYWTTVIFVCLAIFAGIAATNPEKVPSILDREREKAREYLASYLQHAEAIFLDSVLKAEASLNTYFEKQQGSISTNV
jgi:hypothetical protein